MAGGMKLGPQQKDARDAVMAWRKKAVQGDAAPFFYLAGYAGTGKTFLARDLAKGLKAEFAAFTGKAALQMSRAGCSGASTIHSAIYNVEEKNGQTRFKLNPQSGFASADLVVIDEVSMVGTELGQDVLSFGVPVLVLGDPAQLPPVGQDTGFFTKGKPDFFLSEIRRQALDNPIIQMATEVRQQRSLKLGQYGESRVVRDGVLTQGEFKAADQVLCGTHRTRRNVNRKFRRILGYDNWHLPQVGERLVCTKNCKLTRIFNGGMFEVVEAEYGSGDEFSMIVQSLDFTNRKPIEVKSLTGLYTGEFSNLNEQELYRKTRGTQSFDFGYALTCHKAQGSQWDNVITFDESRTFTDWHRWLYTAITRAAETTSIINF